MKNAIKIYVSTYEKYNRGSLDGAWLSLPMDKKVLYRKLRQIAGFERDPEFMIQDSEVSPNIDFRAITECENIEKLNEEAANVAFEVSKSKRTPEEQEAIAEYCKVWRNDRKMQEYCASELSAVYKTEAGDLVVFEKPNIETRFCFNADINGAYSEEMEEWAHKMAYHTSRTEQYFVAENMERAFGCDEKWFDEKTLCGMRQSYNCCKERLKLLSLAKNDRERYYGDVEFVTFTEKDLRGIKATLDAEKEKFAKRLRTWWKRYGADGLHTWTYYSD